jgi:hypothetical protein
MALSESQCQGSAHAISAHIHRAGNEAAEMQVQGSSRGCRGRSRLYLRAGGRSLCPHAQHAALERGGVFQEYGSAKDSRKDAHGGGGLDDWMRAAACSCISGA